MTTGGLDAPIGRVRSRLRAIAAAFAAAALAVLGTGCANNFVAPVRPPTGALFTQISAPIEVDFENTHTKKADGTALRSGVSKLNYLRIPFIYLEFTWGDGSLETSAKRADIDKIYYADYEMLTVLGIFGQYEIVARGE